MTKDTELSKSSSTGEELRKEVTVSTPEPINLLQESTVSAKQVTNNITFVAAMWYTQMATLHEVSVQCSEKILSCLSQIEEITPDIKQKISLNNSTKIIESIDLIVHIKSLFTEVNSWNSVLASVAHHFVVNLNEQLPDDLINAIEKLLKDIGKSIDRALTNVPIETILGITLAPDQKQFSETKAVIADVLSRIEKIKQENKEASQDWSAVEQNAYERITEDSNKNVSGKEFLDWLSKLEQGNDV